MPRARSSRGVPRAEEASPSAIAAGRVAGQRRGRRLDLAALVDDLHAALGLFELRMAEARQLDAALEQCERLLEGEVPLFERLDDGFQFGDRRFEVLDGRIVAHVSSTLQPISPFASVTRTASPRATDAALRTIAVLSAFQQTA